MDIIWWPSVSVIMITFMIAIKLCDKFFLWWPSLMVVVIAIVIVVTKNLTFEKKFEIEKILSFSEYSTDDESDGHHCCTHCDGNQWVPKWLPSLSSSLRVMAFIVCSGYTKRGKKLIKNNFLWIKCWICDNLLITGK